MTGLAIDNKKRLIQHNCCCAYKYRERWLERGADLAKIRKKRVWGRDTARPKVVTRFVSLAKISTGTHILTHLSTGIGSLHCCCGSAFGYSETYVLTNHRPSRLCNVPKVITATCPQINMVLIRWRPYLRHSSSQYHHLRVCSRCVKWSSIWYCNNNNSCLQQNSTAVGLPAHIVVSLRGLRPNARKLSFFRNKGRYAYIKTRMPYLLLRAIAASIEHARLINFACVYKMHMSGAYSNLNIFIM